MSTTLQRITIALLALILTAAGAVAAEMEADTKKLAGTVLMMTPSELKIGTDAGEIEALAIVESSQLDRHLYEGDRAEVWYRETSDQSKVVVRTAKAGSAGVQPSGSEATVSREQTAQSGSAETTSTASEQEARQTGTSATQDEPSYDEVVGNPEDVMLSHPERTSLPQTASSLPALGLAGVLSLLAAGALSVLTLLIGRRSGI